MSDLASIKADRLVRGDGLRREEALAGAFDGRRRDAQPAPGRADAVRRLALPLASSSFSLAVGPGEPRGDGGRSEHTGCRAERVALRHLS